MKKYIIVIFSMCSIFCDGQNEEHDSLLQLLNQTKEDTSMIQPLIDLGFSYFNFNIDTSYYYSNRALLLAKKFNSRKGESLSLSMMGLTLCYMGNYPKALDILLKSLQLAESIGDREAMWQAYNALGNFYDFQNDYRESIGYFFKSLIVAQGMNDAHKIKRTLTNIGDDYTDYNKLDSALYYSQLAYQIPSSPNHIAVVTNDLNNMGNIYTKLNNDILALKYFRMAIPIELEYKDLDDYFTSTLGMAGIFKKQNKTDSALIYSYRAINAATSNNIDYHQMEACNFIASIYESKRNADSAFKYLKITIALKDRLFSREKLRSIQNLTSEENTRQQELEDQKRKSEEDAVKSLQMTAIAVFIPIFFLIVLFLSRIRVKARVVEFLAVVGLLLSFEFITDVIYPYISDWTHDSPLWETLILVIIAMLIEPLNYKIEHWVKKHLVHKSVHKQ